MAARWSEGSAHSSSVSAAATHIGLTKGMPFAVAASHVVFFPPLKTTCVTLSVSLFATLPPNSSILFAKPALLSLLALSLVSTKTKH